MEISSTLMAAHLLVSLRQASDVEEEAQGRMIPAMRFGTTDWTMASSNAMMETSSMQMDVTSSGE